MNGSTHYILTNFQLLTGSPVASAAEAILIREKSIDKVGQLAAMPKGHNTVDLGGALVTPGFIDLQINGCGGVNFNSDISRKTLDIIHNTNLRFGCTSFLPTLITATDDDIRTAIAVVSDYRNDHPERVHGLHIEGPFINPERKGIHDPDIIRTPTQAIIEYLCQNAAQIAKITLAPEMVSTAVIEQLSGAGIVVSIGHTNATCAQAKSAEQAGARFVTHLHNAMSPLASRAPGVVGAAFDSSRLYAGIIADGFHLSWENLRIAWKIMQNRLVLVTDATAAAGSDIEQFQFGGQTVFHKDGKCTGADGTLGGSALTMEKAVQNAMAQGIPRDATIAMATLNPASALGVEQTFGVITEGAVANLTLLDQNFSVQGTVSAGVLNRH